MKENHRESGPCRSDHRNPARAVLGALLAIFLLCLALFPAGAAAKSWEVAGTFGGALKPSEVNEETQLNGVGALAVNYTGAGGVPKGTVYAATHANGANRVARFTPTGSGLKFVERWEIVQPSSEKKREENLEVPFGICGPAVADPSEGLTGEAHCAVSPEGGAGGLGIAVDQATGNVYVGAEVAPYPTGEPVIRVYTPNGSSVIARFGEQGPIGQAKLEAETPNQLHQSPSPGWLTVNDKGEVYAFDIEPSNNFYHRLMVFKPEVPGNFTKYVYAGASADVGAGFLGETKFLEAPVVDEAGNIYVKDEQGVREYNPSVPGAAPICTFAFPAGGISALTVDPKTGEPFFYSVTKKPRRVHELSACEGGTFHETGETAVYPEHDELFALGFDPVRQLSAGRQPGVLLGGAPLPALGYLFAQPEEREAVISELAPLNVTTGAATLSALIDPRGFTTHYAFRYLSQAQYAAQGGAFTGAIEAPAGGGNLEPANGAKRIEATVSGLMPGTSYVFQVIASSNCSPVELTKVCPVESSVATFHTYAVEAAGLVDGRAYELVSPADKRGGQVLPADPDRSSCVSACKPGSVAVRFPLQSTSGGNAVAYEGEPFGSGGALIENEYLGKRTEGGWETTNLTPSLLENRNNDGYLAFDPSLSAGLLRQGAPALTGATPGEYRNLYRQTTANPEALAAVLNSGNSIPTCSPGVGSASLNVTYAGASTDLSKVFLEANDALTLDSSGSCEQGNLYEEAGGALRAVNVLPGGGVSAPGAVFGSGALLGSGNSNTPTQIVAHAISSDGSRAFFTGADGHLYVRIDGTSTLEVPGPGNCRSSTPLVGRICFLTASVDGASVLLSDGQIYAINGAGNAYEPSVDLTQGQGGFLGVAGQSEDLGHLYFVDSADLTGAEENDQGAVAEAGKPNLYGWVGGSTHFIATLAAKDGSSAAGDWVAISPVRTAEASPAGRWLAFQSAAPLTGYENVGICGRNTKGEINVKGPCAEVFIYDSQSESLTCASCNPSGARPVGNAALPSYRQANGSLPQLRYLTNAGRLFFDSGDRLVPGDTNGIVEDLYEFEPEGVGGCSQAGNCLRLISSGRGTSDSNFLTMDETGDNVFFTTGTPLVGADKDELIDLYDARVGGGFPEPQLPAECKGEACQQAAPTPGQPAPSSMGLPGEGNAKPGGSRHCKKGQVKRKGRCVKKHKKHKAKKHHKHGTRHARKGDKN